MVLNYTRVQFDRNRFCSFYNEVRARVCVGERDGTASYIFYRECYSGVMSQSSLCLHLTISFTDREVASSESTFNLYLGVVRTNSQPQDQLASHIFVVPLGISSKFHENNFK